MIPECSLFDENAAIQDHLFMGTRGGRGRGQSNDQEQGEVVDHGSNISNAGKVLRCTREKTTLDHLFVRLDQKATTPLCAVNRSIGTHGAVLSVAGLNSTLDDLRAMFFTQGTEHGTDGTDGAADAAADAAAAIANREMLGPEDDDKNDFCIQQYIEPVDGVRYEVTCTRQALPSSSSSSSFSSSSSASFGSASAVAEIQAADDPNILTIDVVPSNYANYYTYPKNYVPPSKFQQRKVGPPPDDLRQRMCT